MRRKHLFKKYFVPSFLFFSGIAIGFFLLFYVNDIFRIKNIEIVGASSVERSTISTLVKNRSTLTTSESDMVRLIRMRFPVMRIKECHILFPGTLILAVENEKPYVYLITDFGYLALSKNGTVVMKERSSNIPHPAVSFYQTIHHSEYQTGQDIGFTTIKRAIQFVSLLEEEGYKTETVAIDSVDMIACKTKGFEVVFSQSRPVELQSHEVREIVRQIKAGVLRIGRLDLRFDKPVVQLPQK